MLEVRDPRTSARWSGRCRRSPRPTVAAAYGRARAGFAAWRRTAVLDRAAVLIRAAGLIRSRAEEGAVTLVRENGKTLAEARVEVTKTADFLDYYASFAVSRWGDPRRRAARHADDRPDRAGRRRAGDHAVE